MIEHDPPKNYPKTHLVAVDVPKDFAEVVVAAAAKSGVLFEEQILTWARDGAECARMHKDKTR